MPLISNLELWLFDEITFIIVLQVIIVIIIIIFKLRHSSGISLQLLHFISNLFILFTSYACSYDRNGNHAVDDSMEFKCASSLEALCWQEYFKSRFVLSIGGFWLTLQLYSLMIASYTLSLSLCIYIYIYIFFNNY